MASLYDASVPVFLHYLDRADALVRKSRHQPELLEARLVPDMFTAAEQFVTAAGFTLRVAYPLAGKAEPDFPDLGRDHDGLVARIRFAREKLSDLQRADFDDARDRIIKHRAGFAELEQKGEEFLHLFGMPNFLFHLTMGFALLRQGGIEIGKADFDALHDYPHGFRF